MQIDNYRFIPVKDYEGYYEICPYGIIRSTKKGNLTAINAVLQKSNGYYYMSLSKNGVRKLFRHHKLVALHFIPNPENKRTINHKDGDKSNNRVDNLEWATDSENAKHAFKIGLKSHKGEKSPSAKLTNALANDIRSIYQKGGIYQEDIAKQYNITQGRVSFIVNNKSYL